MKRALLIALGMFLTVGVLAQGNVLFQSKNTTPPVNFKILNPDGTIAAADVYIAQLWGGANAESLAPLMSGGAPITAPNRATGYFVGGSKNVDGIPAGVDMMFQVRVYEAAKGSWANSMWRGEGNIVTLKLTGPPATPAVLEGMTDIKLYQIPEPSVLALGLLGLGAFLMRRRS